MGCSNSKQNGQTTTNQKRRTTIKKVLRLQSFRDISHRTARPISYGGNDPEQNSIDHHLRRRPLSMFDGFPLTNYDQSKNDIKHDFR